MSILLAFIVVVTTSAQTTIVTPTTRAIWQSDDYPVVSSYIGEFYKASLVNGDVPIGPPDITVDWGKPPIKADSTIESPPIMALLQPNVEYVAFVRAAGLTDGIVTLSDRSNKSNSFLVVMTQGCTSGGAHAITIRVDDWSRDVAIGARGKVSLTLANSFPIVQLQVKLGGQVIGEVTGTDLRDLAGLFFSVPRTAGAYSITIAAKDSTGCQEQTTAVRLVNVQ